MQNKRIPLATPTMHQEEMGYIKEAFDRNWIAPLGFNCDGFEQEMVDYLGESEDLYALALASGTAALHLAIKLAGVKAGDVVLCSDTTFVASVNPIIYEGAVPVFVDSERETWNMDPVALEKAFEKYPQAKVVLLVHLYGTPAKMDEIEAICSKHGAVLIEDAAEALAATYRGKPCGTFGRYSALSFNGNKLITTSGGGMLLAEKKEARDKALFWATQSKEPVLWYEHKEIGYNYRMSNVVAGIGRGQLLHVEEHKEKKRAIYQRYAEGLAGCPGRMNPYLPETDPNFWLSCFLLEEGCGVTPMELIDRLNEENIEARPIWNPMHKQAVFTDYDFIMTGETSVGEDIFARGLCLPSDIKMTQEEQDRVIAVIRSCFEE